MKKFFQLLLLVFFIILVQSEMQSQAIPNRVPTEINVEIDWMEDATHSHRPSQDEIDVIIAMFACQGITLNVDISNSVGHADTLLRNPTFSSQFFNYDGRNGFKQFKDANQDHGSGWHYCIFGHDYENEDYVVTSSSGLAENPGDDLVVTLGSWGGQIGTAFERAATFAHELGHNLGLEHSGSMNENNVGSYAVTVGSIMSYRYQIMGVKNVLETHGLILPNTHPYKNIDYSHGYICQIDEDDLDEEFGMGFTSVDWNCSGTKTETGVQCDLSDSSNGDDSWCGQSNGTNRTLEDYNEWDNIRDVAYLSASSYKSKTQSCITYKEMKAFAKAYSITQPTLEIESCNGKEIYYAEYNTSNFIYDGKCSDPFPSIETAETNTSSGDFIFLFPGSYPETPVLTKKRTYSGPGTIIIGK